MRKSLIALLALILTITLQAEKKDKYADWKTGKAANIKSQDMQSDAYVSQNSRDMTGYGAVGGGAASGGVGGSFSSAPAHFIRYSVQFETDENVYLLTLSREVSLRQPDIRNDSEYKFKQQGPKTLEVIDSAGKKFGFTIEKVVKKDKLPKAQ